MNAHRVPFRSLQAGRLLRIALPLLVLNALVSFENLRSTLWPRPGWQLSFDLAMAVTALAAWIAWRGQPGVRGLRCLAVGTVFWIFARYLDVTAGAVFGRAINLYWDGRHAIDVLRMGEVPAWQIGLAAVVALSAPVLAYALSLRCWQVVAQELAWPRARGAIAATGLLLLAVFAAHGVGGRDTRWFMSMPVAPVIVRQVELAAGQWLPGVAAAHLSPSPDFAQHTLAGLRGADVLLIFAESYGVTSLDDPQQAQALAPQRAQLLHALAQGGRQVVSARVRSPTFGGGSWLAHAALLSGVDTQDPGHYELLLASQRATLVRHFKSNGWRTVNWMGGLQRPWPEGRFYGFDRYADAARIGYQGLQFGYWRIPDQASMALLHAQELAAPASRRAPRFIVFPTITSHAPFRPIAPFVSDWARLTRADAYTPDEWSLAMDAPASWTQPVPAYVESLAYTFQWLGSYLSTLAPPNLLTIVIGDHQPWATVSGPNASWDVPIHIISADQALLKRFEALGFVAGLEPRQSSTIGMHALTPLLLDAFDDPTVSAVAPQTGALRR